MTISLHPTQHARTAVQDPRKTGQVPAKELARSVHHETLFKSRQRWWSPLLRGGIRPLLMAGDIAACVLAAIITHTAPAVAAVFTSLLVVFFASGGLYKSKLALSVLDDLPRLARWWFITLGLLLAGTEVAMGGASGITMAAIAGAALLLFRALSYGVVRTLRVKGAIAHSTIVVGGDATARDIAQKLLRNPQYGLAPLGFLDTAPEGIDALPAPLLGVPEDLPKTLERFSPRVLVIAHAALPEHQLVALVRACQRNRCEVFVIPWLYEIYHVSEDMEFVWDMPLVRLRRSAYRSATWRLKRMVDVALTVTALVFLSPLLALCALAVYWEGGPGVIFRQERVGCDGRHFQLMKFRSMRPVNESESQTQWNISHDLRVGPVGRFLRVTSLDELPQLFNILRGDMSLVGPRPERPHFAEEFGDLYRGYSARHRVPSGLTGWAQVHGLRGDTSIDDRARFDNFYIENWSLWLDLKIVLRTAISVIKSPGS